MADECKLLLTALVAQLVDRDPEHKAVRVEAEYLLRANQDELVHWPSDLLDEAMVLSVKERG